MVEGRIPMQEQADVNCLALHACCLLLRSLSTAAGCICRGTIVASAGATVMVTEVVETGVKVVVFVRDVTELSVFVTVVRTPLVMVLVLFNCQVCTP